MKKKIQAIRTSQKQNGMERHHQIVQVVEH